jgi:hypothetical protein
MKRYLLALGVLLLTAACDDLDTEAVFPQRDELDRVDSRGKLTGEGIVLGGGGDEGEGGSNNPLGVNSFLWRATLDTLSFMPLASADPFGGTVITDWYEDPKARGERFKVNALILDRSLRSDGLNVSVFKQVKTDDGWQDAETDTTLGRKLEDTILTRARELRVRNAG